MRISRYSIAIVTALSLLLFPTTPLDANVLAPTWALSPSGPVTGVPVIDGDRIATRGGHYETVSLYERRNDGKWTRILADWNPAPDYRTDVELHDFRGDFIAGALEDGTLWVHTVSTGADSLVLTEPEAQFIAISVGDGTLAALLRRNDRMQLRVYAVDGNRWRRTAIFSVPLDARHLEFGDTIMALGGHESFGAMVYRWNGDTWVATKTIRAEVSQMVLSGDTVILQNRAPGQSAPITRYRPDTKWKPEIVVDDSPGTLLTASDTFAVVRIRGAGTKRNSWHVYDVTTSPWTLTRAFEFDGWNASVSDSTVALEAKSDRVAVLTIDGEVCNGLLPTIVGTGDDDRLVGTPGDDIIVGLGGDDIIRGLAGNDTICGGVGDDRLEGGPGADYIDGNSGFDMADYVRSPAGVIVDLSTGLASGGDGTDQILNIERARGSSFNDRLSGARSQTDHLYGGPGNDVLFPVLKYGDADVADGGPGTDTLSFAGSDRGITINLDVGTFTAITGVGRIRSVERVVGSQHSDRITGSNGDDRLEGLGGNDKISPLLGSDRVLGGGGIDTVSYEAIDLDLAIRMDVGVVRGSGFADRLIRIENAEGGPGDDVIVGNRGSNRLDGGGGDDWIFGMTGRDRLIGGTGWDVLFGGPGNDRIEGNDPDRGDPGFDVVSYETAAGPVDVDLVTGVATGEGNDTIVGVEGAIGSPWADTIIGVHHERSVILGLEGADNLRSPKVMVGGPGNDLLIGLDPGPYFGPSADYSLSPSGVTVDLAAGTARGGDGTDTLRNIENVFGSRYNDTIYGDEFANQLIGWHGDDRLYGRAGNDKLWGLNGYDRADGDSGSDKCNAERLNSCEQIYYQRTAETNMVTLVNDTRDAMSDLLDELLGPIGSTGIPSTTPHPE